jgi:leucine efflux protein
MIGITNIWAYLLGTVAIILLPGPNSIYVLSVAARRGVRAGYAGACGVFIGDAVLMILSAAGVASLLRAEPVLFLVVKYAGAGYLCWIGIGMLRGAWRRWDTPPAEPAGAIAAAAEPAGSAATAAPAERNPFRRALVVSLLNPKAILFFISFFIQFVEPGYAHAWLSFLVLGTIAELVSAVYLTTLIFTGSYLAVQFRRRRKLSTALTTGVAAIFVGFAVRLATSSLS